LKIIKLFETLAGVKTRMKIKQSTWMVILIAAFLAIWGVQAKVSFAAPVARSQGESAKGATGEITGKVDFEGTRPKRQEIYMNKDPECLRENQGRTVYIQDGAVNPNATLPNVFVFVKSGRQKRHFPIPNAPVVLDQQGCIFVPHVLGIMVGQTLKVLNSDFTTHNVHVMPRSNPQWNESQPPGAAPFYKKFANPEIMIPAICNEHPWMKAYIGVVDNPFYDVTGMKGTFTIKGVPPGEYTIEAWTASFGTQEKTVRVRAHGSTTLDFTFHHE
jgi:plastocyanin